MDISASRFAIIGATGALGGQLAVDLQSAGATVHLISRSDRAVRAELEAAPRAYADVTDRDALAAAFAALGGHFNGVINAAGVVAFGALEEVPEVVVNQLFAINSLGVANALAAAKPHLEEGSVFASFSGVAADMAVLGMSAYCASKAAAKMTLAVAGREFRRAKIRVLDVRAPHTETGLVDRALFGTAPKMPAGLTAQSVSARVIRAIRDDEQDLPAESFS